MAEFQISERSELERVLRSEMRSNGLTQAGVTLSLRNDLSLATVMVRRGKEDELADVLNSKFDLKLPEPGERTATPELAFAWSGPGQWLASAEGTDRSAFEAMLRGALSNLASISNQSDGRTVIRVTGPAARNVLAKGVPLDLHPSVFGPGHTAVTTVAHVGAHLWQLDDAPTFEFAVFRSFSAAFWHFLTESSAEFGYNVIVAGNA